MIEKLTTNESRLSMKVDKKNADQKNWFASTGR